MMYKQFLFLVGLMSFSHNALSFEIRPMTLDDAQAVVALTKICWQTHYKGLIEQSVLDDFPQDQFLEGRRSFLQAVQGRPGYYACVATLKNAQIVGFADARPYEKEMTVCEISALYVLPEYQGLGIGHALWVAQKNVLRNMNYKELVVWTLEGNLLAENFYKRQGGRVAERQNKLILGKPYPSIKFCFDLES
ncbi:GNAT family N-acetyltransferase [bacterium NHP-B]|nr:GNAT family N-acetyltransferase [bacterium NHP-B]